MRYLVDTNAWIGFFEDAPFLTDRAAETMESAEAECFVSIASIWEAAIKLGLGKLKLPYDLGRELPEILAENGIELLGIEFADVVEVRGLERLHGDPFDRLQAVQARRRRMRVISRDPVFEEYGLVRVW